MALTKVRTHWHGAAIVEYVEDGSTVFIPLWANGCADERSVAGTPRFATLDAAVVAVEADFAEIETARAARVATAQAAPAPVVRAIVAPFAPEYDPATCWECGCPIVGDEGLLDEPQGYAHRSCVGG